jgi:hypothetical protein
VSVFGERERGSAAHASSIVTSGGYEERRREGVPSQLAIHAT